MILVPKKDGSLRPVIYYRKLNSLTIPNRFPIPSLRSLLQDVGKDHAVFSTLDLQSGFFQVQMDTGLASTYSLLHPTRPFPIQVNAFQSQKFTHHLLPSYVHHYGRLDREYRVPLSRRPPRRV